MNRKCSGAESGEMRPGVREDRRHQRKNIVAQERLNLDKTEAVGMFNRYACGDAWLHLHARKAGVIFDGRDVCTLLQPEGGGPLNGDAWGDAQQCQRFDSHGQERKVLVPVVEILEVGEDPRFVDSIVRLKPLMNACAA